MKPFLFFLVSISLLSLSACNPKDPFIDPATPATAPSDQRGEPTAVGKSTGALVTQTIGPEGGSLTSSDGKLTLTIPAGALPKATPISVEPVENTASLGVGTGYHFLPEGTQFAKPATFLYRYTADDLNGADATHLGIATQQTDHSWAMTHQATLDETQHTITTQIRHFSWWSLVTQYKLTADEQALIPGQEATLTLNYATDGFDKPVPDDDLIVPIPRFSSLKVVREWTVNGKLFGDDQTGTLLIKPSEGEHAVFLYTAPTKLPAKGNRSVALGIQLENEAKLMLVYNMPIVPAAELTIDGKTYEDVDLTIQYTKGGQGEGDYFSVQLKEQSRSAKIADFTVALYKDFGFSGSKTYILKGGWEEVQKSTFIIGGPSPDGKISYSTLYIENTSGEIGNAVFDPATLTVQLFQGVGKMTVGTVSCTLHKESKKSESVKVSAKFRGIVRS